MRVPGSSGSSTDDRLVAVEVSFLAGSGRLAAMLLCSEPPTELLVKGQVRGTGRGVNYESRDSRRVSTNMGWRAGGGNGEDEGPLRSWEGARGWVACWA